MLPTRTLLLVILPWLTSCSALLTRPDKEIFDPDTYLLRTGGHRQGVFYAYPQSDSVRMFTVENRTDLGQPAKEVSCLRLPMTSEKARPKMAFFSHSLDVDLFTAPIKYRPPTPDYPHQLQPVINLNAYVGYRVDRYTFRYRVTPAGFYRRTFTHYGLSIGVFTGSGSEHIFPQVLKVPITGEYDGWIWSKGVGLFLGVQRLTVGLLAGTDQLLDRYRLSWLYHERLWVGIGLGVNLN